MRGESQPGARAGVRSPDVRRTGVERAGLDLERRYPVALALYAVLALLAWFTMGEGKVLVQGRAVELRWFPLAVIGGMALRTMLVRHAERIRRDGEKDSF
jgi:hypothetical protein